jgi:23S rRNA (guanosine2251-2'-O)-methyltransferase
MKEWVTGRNPVFETLKARRRHVFRLCLARGVKMEGRLEQITQLARELHVPIEEVLRERLDAISFNHQGVALEVGAYPYVALEDVLAHSKTLSEPSFFLLLDLIQDPQNLGTLLRTAEAMGVHGVIIPSAHSALITPAVVNASSGASEHLLIAQFNLAQAIDRIKALDVWVVGLDEDTHAKDPSQINLGMGLAIVVGNEGSGLRDLVRKSCDEIMYLPMFGKVESLNAAVAGSIALYLARSARSKQA